MFWQRLLVTLALGPLALYLVYLGGWFYFLPLLLMLLLATVEYCHLLQHLGWKPLVWLLLPANLLFFVDGQWPDLGLLNVAFAITLFATMLYGLWLYEGRHSETAAADWLTMNAGILIVGWLGSHFFRLRNVLTQPWQWTALALVAIWVADSAAYAFGKRFGRRKLAPRLSPNKTVEGYISGIIAGTALSVIAASLLHLPVGLAGLFGLLTCTFSPAGDLAISLLKRQAGVKDSGNLLPGHGGALDRVDSLLWSVTIAYYFVIFLA
ncbi:MAG: phosphatidate cytidylyltransferase [Anaerolineales bacterium]|nr:phosphatidate cytidylyltransferase [Anaerolineales bacterium]MCB8951807.1 phosphatidate cytidylyltransferase [Ardenticatenales bacterium]